MANAMRKRLLTSIAALALLPAIGACSLFEGDPATEGRASFEEGDHNSARLLLAKALADDPQNAELRLLYAEAHLAIGDGVGAAGALEAMGEAGLAEGQPAALMAHALLLQDKTEAALEWADKAGEDNPRGAWVKTGALLALDRETEAVAVIDAALENHPQNARLLALRGSIALRQRSIETAQDFADRALAADSANLPALLLAGELAVLREDWATAEERYATASERNRGALMPLLSLAAVQADMGKPSAARETIDRLRELSPAHPMGAFIDAKLAFNDGDLDRAHAVMQEHEPVMRKVPAGQLLLGEIAHLRGNHEQAMAFLRPFLRDNPLHIQGSMVMAQAMLAVGENARAFEVLEAPAKRATASPQMLALASRLAKDQGRDDPFAERVSGINPPADLSAQLLRADRAIGEGEWQAARDIYSGLINKGMGADAMVLNNAALAALRTGNNADALSLARRAVALVPQDPQVLDTMGWVLLQTGGSKSEALSLLGKAKNIAPGNLEIRWHYAAALAANGRKAEARQMAAGVREFAGPAQRDHIDALLASL